MHSNNNWLNFNHEIPSQNIGNIKVQNIITINARTPNLLPPPYTTALSNENVQPMPLQSQYQNHIDESKRIHGPKVSDFVGNSRKRSNLQRNAELSLPPEFGDQKLFQNGFKSDSFLNSSNYFKPISSNFSDSISPPCNENSLNSPAETPKRAKFVNPNEVKLEIQNNFGCVNDICDKENENRKSTLECSKDQEESKVTKGHQKPPYSYSYLIVLALKNSKNGYLPVTDIYSFVRRHYPFYETATDVWKNSIRHNLSLSKGFEKVARYNPEAPSSKKGCLWAMNPEKIHKVDEELARIRAKDHQQILDSMRYPDRLDVIESGCHGFGGVVDSFKAQYGMSQFTPYVRMYIKESLLREPCIQLDNEHWEAVTLPENPVSINGMYVSNVNHPPPYHSNIAREPPVVQQRNLPPSYTHPLNLASHPAMMSSQQHDYHAFDSNYGAVPPNVLKSRQNNSKNGAAKLNFPNVSMYSSVAPAVHRIESNISLPAHFWSPTQQQSSINTSMSPFNDLTPRSNVMGSASYFSEGPIINFTYGNMYANQNGSHSNSQLVVNRQEGSSPFLDSVAGLPIATGCTPYGSPSVDPTTFVTPSTHQIISRLGSGSGDFVSPYNSNSISGNFSNLDGGEILNYNDSLFENLNTGCYSVQY